MLKFLATELAKRPELTVINDDRLFVWIGGSEEHHEIVLEVCTPYEDDELDDLPSQRFEDYARPAKVDDHATLLDACLHELGESEHKTRITHLSTDGDHKDCEAIFYYTEPEGCAAWFALKVR